MLSLPFWLLVLAIWGACRRWPPRKRCIVAEVPAAVLQMGLWSAGYPEAIAFLVAIRVADGLLLYKLTTLTQTQAKTPVVQHSS